MWLIFEGGKVKWNQFNSKENYHKTSVKLYNGPLICIFQFFTAICRQTVSSIYNTIHSFKKIKSYFIKNYQCKSPFSAWYSWVNTCCKRKRAISCIIFFLLWNLLSVFYLNDFFLFSNGMCWHFYINNMEWEPVGNNVFMKRKYLVHVNIWIKH